jgi:hypothetical protein
MTKKRTAINHCSEIERLLQQIKISAAVPPSMRGHSGQQESDHILEEREAHYTN